MLELGLYIGVSGCSLKAEENMAVVQNIPLDRLLFETGLPFLRDYSLLLKDSPYCYMGTKYHGIKYIKTMKP